MKTNKLCKNKSCLSIIQLIISWKLVILFLYLNNMWQGFLVQVPVKGCHGFNAQSKMEEVGYLGYSN